MMTEDLSSVTLHQQTVFSQCVDVVLSVGTQNTEHRTDTVLQQTPEHRRRSAANKPVRQM